MNLKFEEKIYHFEKVFYTSRFDQPQHEKRVNIRIYFKKELGRWAFTLVEFIGTNSTYTLEEWKMLAEIYDEINKILKDLNEQLINYKEKSKE